MRIRKGRKIMSDRAPGFLSRDELWNLYVESQKKIEELERYLERVTQERNDLLANPPKRNAFTLSVATLDPTKVNLMDWS
jgi:hypothetical protein